MIVMGSREAPLPIVVIDGQRVHRRLTNNKKRAFRGSLFLWHNKKNGIYMKSLQHHVRKLAKLMTEADNLIDTNKARKLIKKAEQRAEKIRKRCQQQQQCREDDIESTE